MRLLSESEEDEYLYDSQIPEENIKSVDYDVWLCDACPAQKTYKYVGNSSYSKCPHCGALTYKMQSDHVTKQATTLSTGASVKS